MPYMMSDNGLCVHKQNSDGTRGDVVKCHKTPEEAAAHMRALYANVEDAATKETGPAGDYLVVEDAKMPSTFHLRVKVDGRPDHTLMGAAWAALHGGYRGNKYEGPGKQEAIAKLKRLYEEDVAGCKGHRRETRVNRVPQGRSAAAAQDTLPSHRQGSRGLIEPYQGGPLVRDRFAVTHWQKRQWL